MARTIPKWVRRTQLLAGACVLFLGFSTLLALAQLWWNKDRYPQVVYPAPSFSPEVSWSGERPKDWVKLSAMPRAVWLAVIASEDGGFFKHGGVEWEQSYLKIRSDIRKGKFPGGISTLNQQISKNLYFGARPAITRKLQEIAVAERMDALLGKQQILEIYLNIVEWGPDVVGIKAAARYYFKKPVSLLSEYECAVLANLLPNPRVRGTWVKIGRLPPNFARWVNHTVRQLAATDRLVRAQQRVQRLPASRSLR